MGAWGPGLLDNDVAAAVTQRYAELLTEKKTPAAALARLKKDFKFELSDVDDARDFWLGLAFVQLNQGTVLPEVEREARRYMTPRSREDGWSEARVLAAREAVIHELRQMFDRLPNAPSPRRAPRIPKDPLAGARFGDVYAVRLPNERWGYVEVHSRGAIVELLRVVTTEIQPLKAIEARLGAIDLYRHVFWTVLEDPNGTIVRLGRRRYGKAQVASVMEWLNDRCLDRSVVPQLSLEEVRRRLCSDG